MNDTRPPTRSRIRKVLRLVGMTMLWFIVLLGMHMAWRLWNDPCKHLLVTGRAPTEAELRGCVGNAEFDRRMAEHKARVASANALLAQEHASWFGTTGLDDETERHVAEYVRMEFGETIGEPDALKASDLVYLGAYDEQDGKVHYWRIPGAYSDLHAYVIVSADGGRLTSMGTRRPPR